MKTQLNSYLCVQKRNKNPWYSIPNFLVAYDAKVSSFRLLFFASQAVVGYKFIDDVAPNLVLLNCKSVQEHSWRCLAIPNIYRITTFVSLYSNNGVTWAKKSQSNWIISYRNVPYFINTALVVRRIKDGLIDTLVFRNKHVWNSDLRYTNIASVLSESETESKQKKIKSFHCLFAFRVQIYRWRGAESSFIKL